MSAGNLGDHPYTDIVVHGREVISAEVTLLVRDIHRLGDDNINRIVSDLVWFMRPELAGESWRATVLSSLTSDLRTLKNVTEELVVSRGWETGVKS